MRHGRAISQIRQLRLSRIQNIVVRGRGVKIAPAGAESSINGVQRALQRITSESLPWTSQLEEKVGVGCGVQGRER